MEFTLSIKKEKDAKVFAVDISQEALDLAIQNAKNNDADITFVQSDLFAGLEGQKFDVIVSNPPYIKSEEIKTLQKEVKDFEPVLALDGGKDGFDFYKRIASEARTYLNENGVLLLECGEGQAQYIKDMLVGFKSVEIITDYNQIDRIVKAVL